MTAGFAAERAALGVDAGNAGEILARQQQC